jgi:NAD(P) transhydrogenase subunit beta
MGLAIFGTIFLYEDPTSGERLHNYGWIFGGLFIGSIIGTLAAKKVKMTAMPEMVSLFNGMGGACAALISIVEFHRFAESDFANQIFEGFASADGSEMAIFELPVPSGTLITIFLGLIIGSVSFAGSMIAWGKLNGTIKDYSFKGQHIVNLLILAAIIGLSVILLNKIETSFAINSGDLVNTGDRITFRPGFNIQFTASIYVTFYIILFLSLLYGVFFVSYICFSKQYIHVSRHPPCNRMDGIFYFHAFFIQYFFQLMTGMLRLRYSQSIAWHDHYFICISHYNSGIA